MEQGNSVSDRTAKSETCIACESIYDGRGKGYFYAVLTAIACPCHLPMVGVFLSGSATGVFFEQNFWAIAVAMGALTLAFLAKSIRILL